MVHCKPFTYGLKIDRLGQVDIWTVGRRGATAMHGVGV